MIIKEDFIENLSIDVRKNLSKTVSKIRSLGKKDFMIRELFDPSIYLLKQNGKLLRPSLLFLGARAMGENGDNFIDLAAAIELLHVSSLIHDDIIDKGKIRRGVESLNERYDNNVAMLAGNALISKAIELSSSYGENVMDAVSETVLSMCAGELLDYKLQNSGSMSMEKYIQIAELKTASLTGTSCSMVALCKGNNMQNVLYAYGSNMGIAFQIRDDILDFTGSESGTRYNSVPNSNIVSSIKKKHGLSDIEAMRKAAKLNNHYIELALRKLKNSKARGILEPYARMIEIDVS